jgi:hypothetical protein
MRLERYVCFASIHLLVLRDEPVPQNSTMLTCAFYDACHAAAEATNFGGQTGPDGNPGTISSSDGYCLQGC